MSEAKEEFDLYQGHGDHIDSILDGIEFADFLKKLPVLLQNADVIGGTQKEIQCNLEGLNTNDMRFAILGDTSLPGRISIIIGCDINGKNSPILSLYPEYDGAEVEVKITAIHEWVNQLEATIEGNILDDQREIAFFDTRYCLNKEKYQIGKTYKFKLSAFAYHKVELLKEKTFKFEGDKAIDYLRKIGEEVEYEADGSVKPVVFHMDEMVAFLQNSRAYPHVAQFQSPIFGISEKHLFDGNFYQFDIAIAREDEKYIIIPLIAQKTFFTDMPEEKEPLRGTLWLQGYCVESN